jgi:hypothetical protein
VEINGKKVVDATKPLHISISKNDAKMGKNKDPGGCAAARAKGSKGGKARAAALTPERRSEIASAAGNARWNGEKAAS